MLAADSPGTILDRANQISTPARLSKTTAHNSSYNNTVAIACVGFMQYDSGALRQRHGIELLAEDSFFDL